jgi:hypothetical protein
MGTQLPEKCRGKKYTYHEKWTPIWLYLQDMLYLQDYTRMHGQQNKKVTYIQGLCQARPYT